MRILFLLLLLANLGYFMWQWPQQSNDKILPSGPLPVTPNSKTLTLLSELPNPPAAKPAPSTNSAPQAPAADTP
jgi:hypothetical protein